MQRDILRGGRRLAAAAGVAAMLSPLPVHADGSAVAAVTDSSVCQLTSLVITTPAPITTVPSVSTAGTPYSLSGAGTCTGSFGTRPFSLAGSGTTLGSPTCTSFTSLTGAGTVVVGGSAYPVLLALLGSAAGEQMVLVPDAALSGGIGIAQLTLSQASLLQCAQPSGTTQLSYSGTLLLAL